LRANQERNLKVIWKSSGMQWHAVMEHQMAINVFETYEAASFATTVLGMPSYMNQRSFVVATQQRDYLSMGFNIGRI